MNKYEFGEMVKERVAKVLGEQVQVSLQEVRKNNNVMKLGLMVNDKKKGIAPTLYLEDLYEDYVDGRDEEEILDVILENLRKGMPKEKIDVSFYEHYDEVRDKICYKLINYEKNEEFLKEIPYVPFLDLAICFFYPFWHEKIGSGCILVRNDHVERWGVTTKELWKRANENTRKLFPEACCPMDAMLMEMAGTTPRPWGPLPENGWGSFPIKVLTNRQRAFGSAVILYDDYLESLSKSLHGSFFIIPSSIHEVLILPYDGDEDEESLEWIIQDVNERHVDPEDVLSDRLYYYDGKEKKMKLIP